MYEEVKSALQTILNRKSVRDFIERDVEPDKRQAIYSAILSAPTTENMFMYSVISVSDPEVRARLSKQPAMKRAPMVLVFCADYRRWAHIFDGRTDSNRRPLEGEYQLSLIDAVIAAQNAVLAAEALGLSSVYLGDMMEHYEEHTAALGCPPGVFPVLSLCIGYATEAQIERAPVRRFRQELLIHEEQYHDFSRDELMEMLQDRCRYEDSEALETWLSRFASRCVEGKGALERTRSIRAMLKDWSNLSF